MGTARVGRAAVRERDGGTGEGVPPPDDAQREIEELRRALVSRTVIGEAMGILMERLKITADEAFAELRRVSQRSNVRVAQLAEELAETGAWPPQRLATTRNGDSNVRSVDPQHGSPSR